MKKLPFLILIIILFLVFMMPGILILGIRYIPNNIQPPLEEVQGIYWKFDISQSFVSQKSRLVGVAMSIRNLNLKNDKDIRLDLYEGDNLIRTAVLNGKSIEDGAFVKFLFAEIPDSQNREYRFVLSAPDAREEFALKPFYTRTKPSWAKNLQFAGKEIDGSLSFVTFHYPESRLGLIKKIYQDWLARLYIDKPFLFFYGGLILVLLIALVI